MKIKEKVLKEVRNSGWSPELDVGMSYVEQAIDLTLAEVGKVIDDMEIEGKGYKIQGNFYYSEESIQKSFDKAKKKIKQKLGI